MDSKETVGKVTDMPAGWQPVASWIPGPTVDEVFWRQLVCAALTGLLADPTPRQKPYHQSCLEAVCEKAINHADEVMRQVIARRPYIQPSGEHAQ